MDPVEYKSTRLCFKADIIEPLKDNDYFIIHTRDGSFKMTKADFYRVFSNVAQSDSYKIKRSYSISIAPKRSLQFLFDPVTNEGLVSEEICKKIKEIGKLWKESPSNPITSNPITSNDVITSWNKVVLEWAENEELPLIVRRSSNKRGHVYTHETGREIIVADNTTATWVMYYVLKGEKLFLSDIIKLLEKKEIPIALAFKKDEKKGATYKKTQGKYGLPYWNVCHIEEVGLNTTGPIEQIDIEYLKDHFKKFLSPGNMFVVPKSIAGLGEVQEFIDEQR